VNNFRLVYFCLLLFSLHTVAIPSLENKCGQKGINISLPSESDIIAFDKDCTTAFIGPPASGHASVISAVPSANLSFCPAVKLLPEVITKLMQAIDFWTEQLLAASNEYLALEKQYDAERLVLIEFQETQSFLEEDLLISEQELSELMKEVKEAKTRLMDCQDLNSLETCQKLEQDFIQAKRNFVEFRNQFVNPLKDQISELGQKSKTLERKLKQLARNIEENIEIFDGYKRRLASLRNEAVQDYSIFGALEGMTVQLLFESKWMEHLEKVRRQNQGLPIHIAPLPITQSMAYVDTTIVDGNQLNIPSSLIYANLPGFTKTGTIDSVFPTGETIIENLDPPLTPINSFISGISGKLILSLIGSCAFTDAKNRIKRDLNFRDMTGFITINSFHEYPILHSRRYKVHFRLSKFAEEIERRTEEGGFFETSAIHEIIKNYFDEEDFSIEFETDTPGHEYSPEEQKAIEIEAKKEILDRVLKEIAIVHRVGTDRRRIPSRPKRSGADIINEELECFGWSYCYATKFIVGVLDSILGRKDAVAKFKAKNDRLVTHTYSDAKPVSRTFTTTFGSQYR